MLNNQLGNDLEKTKDRLNGLLKKYNNAYGKLLSEKRPDKEIIITWADIENDISLQKFINNNYPEQQ